jgi:deoxycytidylate deaminase
VNKSILKLAIEEAEKSTHHFRVGAVVFKGKRIFSSGRNEIRSCSKMPDRFMKWNNSLHAEQKAILNARRDLNGYDMLVIRIGKSGSLLLAKPCEVCMRTIEYVGINNIFFSNNEGEIKKL